MNLVLSIDQLKDCRVKDQFWYYVILMNPRDLSPAGRTMIDNFNIFHVDSGSECDFFVPGYKKSTNNSFLDLLRNRDVDNIHIGGYGNIKFSDYDFVHFYKEIERLNNMGWRYSGECELLLFNIGNDEKIILSNFASYNLDDIVRNHRNIYEFIRAAIYVGKDAKDRVSAKRVLDTKFYELIMPMETESFSHFEKAWGALNDKGFAENSYYFISYSSKDFKFVSEVRSKLCDADIPCWMAPYDIPQGTNYALIIEHAIKHAKRFVLMLSKSATESVWVLKELLRAIDRFQLEAPEKICVVWVNGQFPIQDTPFALPLEDIQITVDMQSNPQNFFLITPPTDIE